MTEREAREALVEYGKSLFIRGYSCGTSGNLSMRLEEGGYLMSPTNVSLGGLEAGAISKLDPDGRQIGGAPPTKEAWLHMAMYRARSQNGAVVHLHSTYATALSCRSDRPADDVVPALTPYVIMRVGRVPLVPYARPGDLAPAALIERLAVDRRAVLLANHGPVVAGPNLEAAVAAAEELEETARLFFLLEQQAHRLLTPDQVAELERVFGR